ncbi:B12 binding domain protein [Candidatus Burarchaeum australiense]|nr:B12 binding domain protein [Candidatus Burarchaeum australiense]
MGRLGAQQYGDLLDLRRRVLSDFINQKQEPQPQPYGQQALEQHLLASSYPVLSILAPALTSHENKIEFPGDPMCIYTALSYPISQVVLTKTALDQNLSDFPARQVGPYNDLFPAWFNLPSDDYRASIAAGESITYSYNGQPLNTDQYVFDPRVWNGKVRDYLEQLLSVTKPKVVLLSSVSPAHRYALEIARLVKAADSDTLVVLGGRHADETIRMHKNGESKGEVTHAPSGLVNAIRKGIIAPDCVDFMIAGEGYYALDFLMKCISLSMDVETKRTTKENVIAALEQKKEELAHLPGTASITYLPKDLRPVSLQIHGKKTDLADLPLPYEPFAIRARFPIFRNKDGSAKLTAHANTAQACPFSCSFCSESSEVVGQLIATIQRHYYRKLIEKDLKNGAAAMFFDDSMLCGGNEKSIAALVGAFYDVKKQGRDGLKVAKQGSPEYDLFYRMANIEWGAQFTADFLVKHLSVHNASRLLKLVRDAGCTYIYMGIESASENVADALDKHKLKHGKSGEPNTWLGNIRQVLQLAKGADIRVGASVLFGLQRETKETIRYTIEEVGKLVDEGLLYVVSPNILTYHPATAITKSDGMEEKLDYISPSVAVSPPYVFFEEAFPGVVSIRLTEADIWDIHKMAGERWKAARNMNPMQDSQLAPIQAPSIPRHEFYADDGLKLIDSANYPKEISSFLQGEGRVISKLIANGEYDTLVEVGAMDSGFFLSQALKRGASYVGIDLVPSLIEKLDDRIMDLRGNVQFSPGQRVEAHVGNVLDMPSISNQLSLLPHSSLVSFPFNSFGNIPEAAEAISKVAKAGMDLVIFTYTTDARSMQVRTDYYANCNYAHIESEHTPAGVLFHSEDGLWSYAYDEGFIHGLMERNGYEASTIRFGDIGVAYVGKLKR